MAYEVWIISRLSASDTLQQPSPEELVITLHVVRTITVWISENWSDGVTLEDQRVLWANVNAGNANQKLIIRVKCSSFFATISATNGLVSKKAHHKASSYPVKTTIRAKNAI